MELSRPHTLFHPKNGVLLGLTLCMAGFSTSPALLSIGTLTTCLSALLSAHPRTWRERLRPWKIPLLLGLILIPVILSVLYTKPYEMWRWRDNVIIKLPLVAVPVCLALAGIPGKRALRFLLLVFAGGVFFTGTGTLIHYMLNRTYIDWMVSVSKPMPIWLGINHIYFSILQSFSLFGVIWLWLTRKDALFRWEMVITGVLGLGNLLYLHVNTTRTGLGAFYLTLLILGLVLLLHSRRYLAAGALTLGVILMPVAGYYLMSSFRKRIDNTYMDVSRYFAGKDPNYLSIGTRIESWKTAFHIFQHYPLRGVGPANLEQEMTEQYVIDKTLLCPENFEKPHNQFIEFLSGLGIIGFSVWALAWFSPLWSRGRPRNMLFYAFWIIATAVMMFESLVERQVGVMFVSLFWMLLRAPELEAEPRDS